MNTREGKHHTGHCLCGAVAFSINGDIRPAVYCHCEQCRRWTGHYLAAIEARCDDFILERGSDRIGWYRASDFARRGFCKTCGSTLFWQADRHEAWKDTISIAAGVMDAPTGIVEQKHIFVAFPGDYYTLQDGLPQESMEQVTDA